jgi:hypothetical protein
MSARFTVSLVIVSFRGGKNLDHSRLEARRLVEYYSCYRATISATTTTTTTTTTITTTTTAAITTLLLVVIINV